MKKTLLFTLVAVMLLSLSACGGNSGGSTNSPNKVEGETIGEVNQELNDADQVDLSIYDEHGEWHCGRMWVHKTDGGYDHVAGYYAYIDEKGDLVTGWHSDQEWIVPFDFDQNVALIYTGRDIALEQGILRSQNSQPVSYSLIDLNGKLITFVASAYTTHLSIEDKDNWADGGFNREYENYPVPHAFNQYGLLLFDQVHNTLYGQHFCYALLTDGTIVPLRYASKSQGSYYEDMDLNNFGEQFANGYLSYCDFRYRLFLFFDKEGNVATDLTDFPYPIREMSDVSSEKTIDVTFLGVDDNLYCVTVDMDGQWLNEPTLVNN